MSRISRALPPACGLLLLAAPAAGEPPRGIYVVPEPGTVERLEAYTHTSNIIYLNGCHGGGCTISPGFESSIENRSSILNRSVTIQPFSGGEVVWDAIVECVRRVYAPFDVIITEVDPSPSPHFMAIVAGSPEDAGFGPNIGGVAPFNCGIINNAITFTFANVYGGSVPQICWTVAQETAHAFGLDHQLLCPDPMTYLGSCSPYKTFQDIDAECGEWAPRDCFCPGRVRQNSFRTLRDHFGPGSPVPPALSVIRPRHGDLVSPGFPIEVDASHELELDGVEFFVNNVRIGQAALEPYALSAPLSLPEGILRLEARARDRRGAVGTARVEVLLGEPCRSAASCGEGELTCVDGRCVPGPGAPGGLGEPCREGFECASGLCGDDGESRHCVEECRPGARGCPDGFGCRKDGDSGACWPGFSDGGGCRAGPAGQHPGALLLAALALLALRARRGYFHSQI